MDASRLHRWARAAAGFLLPPRCLVCNDKGQGTRELCAGCQASLVRNIACCGRCAVPLPVALPECEACQQQPRPWADIWVPYVYAWPLDSLEVRFKFAGSLAAGRVLSTCWLDTGLPPSIPEMLIPVPLHTSRLRTRGYNQSLELARPLARRFGIPLRHDVLRRARRTEAQTEQDAVGRIANVRDAFVVRRPPSVRHVAVIDDVMTTGSTLAECVRVLGDAGIDRVDVWALARTPRSGDQPDP